MGANGTLKRNADQDAAPRRVRLKAGHAGGWVNRLGRRVEPDEVVTTDAETADWLLASGDFVAVDRKA